MDAEHNIEKYRRERVEKILELFSYENLNRNKPDFCPCALIGKPCHDMKDLNCFACWCPNYDTTNEGGCKIGNPQGKGKFFERPDGTKIWDCSDCTWPHEKENARKLIREKMF